MQAPTRSHALLRLITATVLLPLAVLLLGLWQTERSKADLAELVAAQRQLMHTVTALEAHVPRDGRGDTNPQFRWEGRVYVGAYALNKAREALDEVEMSIEVAHYRRLLPPVVACSAGLAAGLSLLILLAGLALGRAGRASREMLVRGFSLVRRGLPIALAAQVILATAAFVCVVIFEAAALLRPGWVSPAEIKLVMLAIVGVMASLWVAASTLWHLRSTLAAFEPDPMSIIGRAVSRDEAPGLWRLLDALAERLGALQPDHVVVGLQNGFHVTSGSKVLQPGGRVLTGRTLYLPLPYLPMMRPDEVVAVLGHELAHFSGRDTDYSLRFLPIYAGVGRSLEVIWRGGAGRAGAGSFLLGTALRLGLFVMDQFHHAVRHWSRQREFAADAAGASLTSPEAVARALLRTAVLEPRIAETLTAAVKEPSTAPEDLVTDALHRVAQRGVDDPSAHLEDAQPHPTDTHPPTRQRLAALGCTADAGLLSQAAVVSSPEALSGLNAYFADAACLCRAATVDFLDEVRRVAAANRAHLKALVTGVGAEDRVLSENFRGAGLFLLIFGAVFALLGLSLAVLDPQGLSHMQERVLVATAVLAGLSLAGYGLVMFRRGERPYLVLRSAELYVPGLDRAIAWSDVLDLDITLHNHRMISRLLLAPGAQFPQRAGRGRAKLDPARRIVTITAALPRRMKPQAFAELIGSYRAAAEARRRLANDLSGTHSEAVRISAAA